MTETLHPYLTAVEDELRHVVTAPRRTVAPFFNMMAYHLGWLDQDFRPADAYRGKKLRPLLCLLSCQAAGGDWHTALPAAAALELVHNFSLIHARHRGRQPHASWTTHGMGGLGLAPRDQRW